MQFAGIINMYRYMSLMSVDTVGKIYGNVSIYYKNQEIHTVRMSTNQPVKVSAHYLRC